MMQMRDWISGGVGAVIFLLGLLPLANIFNTDFIALSIIKWIVAAAALYLVFNSVIEVTNSNTLGWISVSVALLALIAGLLPILSSFGIGPSFFELGWAGKTFYNIVLAAEGIFLMIATFAMEL